MGTINEEEEKNSESSSSSSDEGAEKFEKPLSNSSARRSGVRAVHQDEESQG